MAAFTLKKNSVDVDRFTVNATDLDANKEWVTDEFTIQNFDSIHLNLNYHTVTNDQVDSNGLLQQLAFQLESTLETQAESGLWYPIASQLSGHRGTGRGPIRSFIVQPNLVNVDTGVEHIIFSGFGEKSRIVREQGQLGTKIRLRLTCVDFANGGLPFVNTNISIYGNLY